MSRRSVHPPGARGLALPRVDISVTRGGFGVARGGERGGFSRLVARRLPPEFRLRHRVNLEVVHPDAGVRRRSRAEGHHEVTLGGDGLEPRQGYVVPSPRSDFKRKLTPAVGNKTRFAARDAWVLDYARGRRRRFGHRVGRRVRGRGTDDELRGTLRGPAVTEMHSQTDDDVPGFRQRHRHLASSWGGSLDVGILGLQREPKRIGRHALGEVAAEGDVARDALRSLEEIERKSVS